MISIIIIVKNDRGIEDTLKTLIKISKPEKTEIIVIDASKKEILLDIKRKFPKVKWFYYVNKEGKKVTIPGQRNMGIKKSRGDLIVFIDANCIPVKNWLIEIVSPIRKNKENIIAGLVKSFGGKSIWDVEQERMTSKKYVLECSTLNMAFNKGITKKIGYFDENFNYGSDMDFTWRLIDSGYKIRYNKKAIVYHDWGDLKTERKRSFRYGEAKVTLYKKHPDKLKNLFSYNKDLFTVYAFFFFLYILFLPLAFFWPYYLLFILVPIIKNIRRRPFDKLLIDWFFGFGIWKGLIFSTRIKDER